MSAGEAKNSAYDVLMSRKPVKHRPPQGELLFRLRVASGMTQTELGELVGERHSTIAFWEKSDKPPRSEVLPSLATALGVSVEDLLKPAGKIPVHKGGPVGKLQKTFQEASRLPRSQQEKIVEVLQTLMRGMHGANS